MHLRNIFAKIGVASRTEASLYAVRAGLVVVDMPGTEAPPLPPVAEAPPTPPAAFALAPADIEPAPITRIEAPIALAATPLASTNGTVAPAQRWPRAWIVGALFGLIVLIGAVILALRILVQPAASIPTATVIPATPAANVWRTRAQMGIPRVRFGLASYNNDKLYVIGGIAGGTVSGAVERYTPANDTWTQLANKPTPVADVQVVAIGGKLYVAGGQLASGAISDQFEVYNPDQDEWQSLPKLPAPRSQYVATVVDGKLYLFGGWDGTAYRTEVWMFDPDSGTWQTRTPMLSARGNMGADIVGNRVHLIGGRDANGPLALHQSYDPSQDRAGGQPWRVLPRLPRPIESPASATVLNSVYTFDPQASEVLIYDATNESWRSFAVQLPAGNTDIKVVLVNTNLHLLGGSAAPGAAGFHLQYEVIYRTFLPLGPVP